MMRESLVHFSVPNMPIVNTRCLAIAWLLATIIVMDTPPVVDEEEARDGDEEK